MDRAVFPSIGEFRESNAVEIGMLLLFALEERAPGSEVDLDNCSCTSESKFWACECDSDEFPPYSDS